MIVIFTGIEHDFHRELDLPLVHGSFDQGSRFAATGLESDFGMCRLRLRILAAEQIGEARVRAQRIENGVYFHGHYSNGAFLAAFLQHSNAWSFSPGPRQPKSWTNLKYTFASTVRSTD